MSVLQGRKFNHHRAFRTKRTATGFSCRFQCLVCKINFVGKGFYILKVKRSLWVLQKTSLQFLKKAVLLKNCSNILNSKIDNSIRWPTGEKKPPKVPFNRLSSRVLRTRRKLSYCAQYFRFGDLIQPVEFSQRIENQARQFFSRTKSQRFQNFIHGF